MRPVVIVRLVATVVVLLSLFADGAAAKSVRNAVPQLGAQRSFWVIGSSQEEYERLSATLVYDGRLARIWVDNRDTARIDAVVLRELARSLDTATPAGSRDPAKGIIENEQDVFGKSPTRFKAGGKDDFLLFDIPNASAEGLMLLGYFHTKDQYSRKEVPMSNELNMLYIDSREGMRSVRQLMSTIAHEYQHLIHFGRNPHSERFYTEALSELATVITGFHLSNRDYMAHTNSPLFRWNETDAVMSQVDYQRGLTLMRYLHEQYGERFIHSLVDADGEGVARIEQALRSAGYSSDEHAWQDILTRFAVANYLQNDGEGVLGYASTARMSLTRPMVADIGSIPAAYRPSSMRLEPYGSSYFQFESPRELDVAVSATEGYRVVAITYADGSVRVESLSSGRYRLGDPNGGVDRVVLAYISLSEERQVVRLGVESVTSTALR